MTIRLARGTWPGAGDPVGARLEEAGTAGRDGLAAAVLAKTGVSPEYENVTPVWAGEAGHSSKIAPASATTEVPCRIAREPAGLVFLGFTHCSHSLNVLPNELRRRARIHHDINSKNTIGEIASTKVLPLY
jgi:hypothetical protein